MAFDFQKSLIKVQGGRIYLPVAARIQWFREQCPDWSILTEIVEIDHEKQFGVFRASILNAEGRVMATATKKEDVKGFGDYLEKSETGAVGRALALCGYGTQFAPEFDETPRERYADGPREPRGDFNNRGGSQYPQRPAPVRQEAPAPPADDPMRELNAVIAGLRESVFGVGDKAKADYKAWLKKTRKIESIGGQEVALVEGVRDDLQKMAQDAARKQAAQPVAANPGTEAPFDGSEDDPFADDTQIPAVVA